MSDNFDIKRARRDTRHCDDVVHFNNAGAALMPAPVADALHHYLHKEERYGGYETAAMEARALDSFYTNAATLLNCQTHEIAFVDSATRAWDMAFYGFTFAPGDIILTTLSEYGSNVIAYLQQAERTGVKVVFVPNDEYGQIDTKALETLIDDRVKLISLNHIPTGGGLVNPAAEVGRIAQAAHIPFLLDSCQSIGQMPIDVDAIGCDIACGTGRKYLRGPRGTGLLYVRDSLIDKLNPPTLDQHAASLISATEYRIRDDAKRFECWEQFVAGKAALSVAIDYARSYGLESIKTRIYHLATTLRQELSGIDGITLTDEGQEQCGIVTFVAEQMPAPEIKQQLAQFKINVTTPQGSGSLVSFQERGLDVIVRASLHYYNTKKEIDFFISKLRQVLTRQK